MNVVVWARVSSREQREGYSIDAQLRAMRDKATKNGWTIVREFDVAESAKRGAERTVFNKMFKWVKANAKREKINAILAHKLDRVCRNMRDAVRLQELEDACGVKLAFVDNQFGPGAAGALSFNVMAAVAQYYSDNLRSEVLKGMDEKVRQGWPTGHAPFGYVNVDDCDEPVKPHPEKLRTVARIFELYASGNYTFKSLADKLQAEGHTYRPSQPRFNRTTLSYIMNNRFYTGELKRNGKIYPGKYKLFIDRPTFDVCQNLLKGKNRRTGNPDIMLSGCVLRCTICGHAITGEQIRRKLRNGGRNVHVYYKCGNNHQPDDHPKVRWREEDVEAAILKELDSMRIPSQEIADWFRDTLAEAFSDVSYTQQQQRKMLVKRKSELANMQDRLLNGYLAGTVDEAAFHAKSVEFKREAEEMERQLDAAGNFEPSYGEMALSVFDFSQNLANIWRGSNSAVRREILNCVSSNRTISNVSLVMIKRKPFDFLAERPFMKDSRGEWI
ncbi:MAG: recombinase family protein [Planctomycetota bacterium]|nr:MAG: recombinase family protein [Planctomycetota bacterium]